MQSNFNCDFFFLIVKMSPLPKSFYEPGKSTMSNGDLHSDVLYTPHTENIPN